MTPRPTRSRLLRPLQAAFRVLQRLSSTLSPQHSSTKLRQQSMTPEINSPSPVWYRLRSPHLRSRRSLDTKAQQKSGATPVFIKTPPRSCRGDMNLVANYEPQSSRADLRWSEVIPPQTALTFGALWDPEEGMVTFGGAALRSNDSRVQLSTADVMESGEVPSTAKGSGLFPYAHSRFAASELSTNLFPQSPTRRSSAGTGLPLEASSQVDLHHRGMSQLNGAPLPAHVTSTPCASQSRHKHNESADSGSTNNLAGLGFGLCKAFRRDSPSKHTLSKQERYSFLERTAVKEKMDDEATFQSPDDYAKDTFEDDPPKSAGLKSIFARSIWARSAMHFACDSRAVRAAEDTDSIALDSGFDHFDGDSGFGVSYAHGAFELDNALQRDTRALKSTFSWTTTSTSRYIDVAEFLEDDSDSDSTLSREPSPMNSGSSHATRVDFDPISNAVDCDVDSEWLPIEPPTPHAGLAFPTQGKVHRKLVKKHSSSTVDGSNRRARHGSKLSFSTGNPYRYRTCPQCDFNAEDEIEVSEENDIVRVDMKGKTRAISHPEISDPLPLRNSVTLGRPAVQRSASSPASVVPQDRAPSSSQTPSPADVLARTSYNHQWTTAESVSHNRSSSEPNVCVKSATIGHASHPWFKRCRHSQLGDVRDILRGVQTGIRPSTPLPGMPNSSSPVRSRPPPPSSFRPLSAGGASRPFTASARLQTPSPSNESFGEPESFQATGCTRSQSQNNPSGASTRRFSKQRARAFSLDIPSSPTRGSASVAASPIRSYMHHPQTRNVEQLGSVGYGDGNEGVRDDESGRWICVDVRSPLGADIPEDAVANRLGLGEVFDLRHNITTAT